VQMQADKDARRTVEDITRLTVRNAKGAMVPLSELVTPHWISGLPKLDRYNGLPSMKIAGGPAPGQSTGDALRAMEEVAAKLPQGFGYEWSATSYEERLSGTQAPLLFGISIIVVFLCLAALYESWSIPVAILLAVPLGIIGAVLATSLRGLTRDIYFQVAVLTTVGLASKNAILIVEFAKEYLDQGLGAVEAALHAVHDRLRPILMTSLAFGLGVLPLALAHGAGAGAQRAIGTGVVGGMVAGTLLGVFLIPLFFVVIERLLERMRAARG